MYTGGTTGLAKGAMLTHGNLVWNTMQSAAWFPELRDGAESVMCVLPFFHSYGMTVCMNLGILKAAKLVLMPRFDLKRTLKAVQKEKATLFPGVPRLYVSINESPRRRSTTCARSRRASRAPPRCPPRSRRSSSRSPAATWWRGTGSPRRRR